MTANDPGTVAHGIMDANLYMVLATADATGRPWATPVYFAHSGYEEFFWVSSPEATHSRNIAARPEVSIVIFDSQVPVGSGQGVYVAAVAEPAIVGRRADVLARAAAASRVECGLLAVDDGLQAV